MRDYGFFYSSRDGERTTAEKRALFCPVCKYNEIAFSGIYGHGAVVEDAGGCGICLMPGNFQGEIASAESDQSAAAEK